MTFVLAGSVGMESGQIIASLLNRALNRRRVNNRLRTENTRLRQGLRLALAGSAHERLKLIRDYPCQNDFYAASICNRSVTTEMSRESKLLSRLIAVVTERLQKEAP